jgi:CRISPR-associated protein Cmr1
MEYVKLLTVRHGARFALAPWPDPPPFPVLSKARAPAGISGGEVFGDWADAAAYAGEQLRRFRATKAYPGAVYQPQLKTPEWDNTIHGGQNRFRLGALGLPVVYKDRYEVNALGADGKPLRRASPLWLRPVGGSDGWRVLSYAFCGQFLPGAMPVSLRQASGRVKEVEVGDRDIAEYADLWIRKLAADEWFEVGDRPA